MNVRQLVFMIDVDNTILDNDGVKSDMERRMLDILGPTLATRLWELYEIVRQEIHVVDFIETMRRLALEHPATRRAIDLATTTLMNWDFRKRLYPNAIDTITHLKSLGLPVIVSDGDPVYQPSKILQCGVTAAVEGRVLIFVHKEKHLRAIERYFDADHYVLIDDKPGILMRSKAALGDRLTTVQVLQGKYALDPKLAVDYTPDIVAQRFSDLRRYDADAFTLRKRAAAAAAGA